MKNVELPSTAHRICVAAIRETQTDRLVTSSALLGQRDALVIQHQDTHYILRITRAGKLILTK
ncbi:MAG: hemin uptake protein HemP [Gammaproteobacteria bacterium]|nr:hemin uptake protein HemP [Gammaproteobacteria bacterium]MBU1978793.1 hemin uptake protein HemP [Gammaproteobacteria bacterium]